jgi:hypothetical protein
MVTCRSRNTALIRPKQVSAESPPSRRPARGGAGRGGTRQRGCCIPACARGRAAGPTRTTTSARSSNLDDLTYVVPRRRLRKMAPTRIWPACRHLSQTDSRAVKSFRGPRCVQRHSAREREMAPWTLRESAISRHSPPLFRRFSPCFLTRLLMPVQNGASSTPKRALLFISEINR